MAKVPALATCADSFLSGGLRLRKMRMDANNILMHINSTVTVLAHPRLYNLNILSTILRRFIGLTNPKRKYVELIYIYRLYISFPIPFPKTLTDFCSL